MSSDRIKDLLETLGTYHQTDIIHTISFGPNYSMSLSYNNGTNCYEINHSDSNDIAHYDSLEDALFAVKNKMELQQKNIETAPKINL
ncbi:hypothetical protein AB685_02775 [Bacillus sp. LL01]|uniref:hypothetical protein n=1 Tax=Bacillus sp. LL01 TaxID=1665556 RepID=UPI00064CFA33|nr:hypothetical protein [Bacillus sp. LL01]KMJ59803.1 hypothetical protein AB685_02775 [Bacillus sp. LL01]